MRHWEVGVGRWLKVEGRGCSQMESETREVFEIIGMKGQWERKIGEGWDEGD